MIVIKVRQQGAAVPHSVSDASGQDLRTTLRAAAAQHASPRDLLQIRTFTLGAMTRKHTVWTACRAAVVGALTARAGS